MSKPTLARCPALLWSAALLALPVFVQTAPPADPAPKRLTIVAPRQFHDALKPYAEYMRKNLPTDLVALEDALKSTDGVDDPERLKRFLYDAWRKRDLGYVLLVGMWT